jgi:hypothetical protein
MSDYTDIAPNLSQFVDEETFKTDFPEPPDPPTGPPNPDAAKKLALYAAFRDEFLANDGAVNLRRLARQHNVPQRWCEILMRECTQARSVVWTAALEE